MLKKGLSYELSTIHPDQNSFVEGCKHAWIMKSSTFQNVDLWGLIHVGSRPPVATGWTDVFWLFFLFFIFFPPFTGKEMMSLLWKSLISFNYSQDIVVLPSVRGTLTPPNRPSCGGSARSSLEIRCNLESLSNQNLAHLLLHKAHQGFRADACCSI